MISPVPDAPDRSESIDAKAAGRFSGHITYLDGIRGLAALYVVMYHAYTDCIADIRRPELGQISALATNWLQFGHISVSVFIVLSGYCLTLPLTRTPFRFNIPTFIKRRAHRILPPYYAALLLTLLITFAAPSLRRPTHGNWDVTQPAFTAGAIVSHLLLVQDLSAAWMFKISHPMWSVALEWQIYFVFALVMVPLWRMYGMGSVLAAMFVAGYLLDRFNVADTCSHYLFLFALGMWGAEVKRSLEAAGPNRWRGFPWSIPALVCGAAFLALSRGNGIWLENHVTMADLLVGIVTVSVILLCDRLAGAGNVAGRFSLLRIFQSQFAVGLGRFSYSLYLMHAPILALIYVTLTQLHPSRILGLTLEECVAVPVSVAAAYVFFLVFERPFLNPRK